MRIQGTKYSESFYEELNACLQQGGNPNVVDALQSMSMHNQARILDVLLDELSEAKIIERMEQMCIPSLDATDYENWEKIKMSLYNNRKALRSPTER